MKICSGEKHKHKCVRHWSGLNNNCTKQATCPGGPDLRTLVGSVESGYLISSIPIESRFVFIYLLIYLFISGSMHLLLQGVISAVSSYYFKVCCFDAVGLCEQWLGSNWRLRRCSICVWTIALLTFCLNIEPVIGLVLQNDYSSSKTKTPFVPRPLYLRNVSHISPEINSNIHSPGVNVLCIFVCFPVAELMISARVFLPPLLLIVLLTMAVNDSPREAALVRMLGDGTTWREKPIFKSTHGFYS